MDLNEAVELASRAHQFDDGLDPADTAVWVLIAHARRSLDAPQAELATEMTQEESLLYDLRTAAGLIAEIAAMREVRAELKAAFARNELEGGAKAAYDHPLYVRAEERITQLHHELLAVF